MGIIEEIYCEQFMCHPKMKVTLGRNINFITGENGSGKSAIIAALQICLGASARLTHRGTSLKRLIRKGHDGDAIVRITLLNDDKESDAFEHEKYGDQIKVERIIRQGGTSDYRLKDVNDKIVSRKKADLDNMIDHFNIQIENPCAVLDQENAKKFLKGSEKDRYEFFLKATDLFSMKAKYNKMDVQIKQIENEDRAREADKLEAMKRVKDEAEREFEEAKEIGQLESRSAEIRKQLAWAYVAEIEGRLSDVRDKVLRNQTESDQYRDTLTETTVLVEKLEIKQAKANKSIEEVQRQLEEVDDRKARMKEQMNDMRRPIEEAKNRKKNLQKEIKTLTSDVKKIDHRIQKERAEFEQRVADMKGSEKALAQNMEKQESTVNQLKSEIDELEKQDPALMKEIQNMKNLHRNASMDAKSVQEDIQNSQSHIQRIKAQSQNKINAFGHKCAELVQLIARNRNRFSELPVGPLGQYVTLPEAYTSYGSAVQSIVGGVIGSFVVSNGRDKVTLEKLKNQIGCQPRDCKIIISKISTSKFTGVRFPEDRRLAELSLGNILQCSDPTAYNTLIDQTSMESILLFPTQRDAEEAIFLGPLGRQHMPAGVHKAFMPDGSSISLKDGNQFSQPAPRKKRRCALMGGNTEQDIQYEKQRINQLHHTIKVHQQNVNKYGQEVQAMEKQQHRISKEIDQKSRKLTREKAELRNLRSEFESNSSEVSINVHLFQLFNITSLTNINT